MGKVPADPDERTKQGMRSRKAARRERRLLRQLSKELSTISGFSDPRRPAPHLAKDFLGVVVTLAVIGAIGLELTTRLASRCEAARTSRTRRDACSGLSAVAYHAHGAVTLTVTACAVLAVITFTWYLLWGYKTNGQVSGNQDASDH